MRSNYNKNIVLQNNFSKKKGATSFAPHIIESKFPTGNTQAELSTQIRLFNLGIQHTPFCHMALGRACPKANIP